MKSRLLTAVAALALTLTLANCAQNPVSGLPNFVTMSESQEVQTGRQEDVGGQAKSDAALREALPEINATIARFHAMGEPGAGQPLKIIE